MEFINDYHVVVDFGKHKGKRIMDLPPEYQDWVITHVKKGPVIDALKRIKRRKGVTFLIKDLPVPSYIPEMIEVSARLTPIQRPADLDPSLFGSFVEYYTKYSLGLSIDDEPQELLALYGLAPVPEHLTLEGELLSPNRRIEWTHRSLSKSPVERTVADICNLSFSHAILLDLAKPAALRQLDQFNEAKGAHLYTYVKENESYFKEYFRTCHLPIPNKEEQATCDKISVGCIIGIIDMISNGVIVDIKCCIRDNIDYYRKQLFTYACLHYLRYKSDMQLCQVCNFMTGKQFIMALGDSCKKHAREYIRQLGSYCKEHLKLFDAREETTEELLDTYREAPAGTSGQKLSSPSAMWKDGATVQLAGTVARATYGPEDRVNDVTELIRKLQVAGKNMIVGGIHTVIGDPFPGIPKFFKVWYEREV